MTNPLIAVEQLRTETEVKILQSEGRVLRELKAELKETVEESVKTGITDVLLGPMRLQTCPIHEGQALMGAQLAGLEKSVESVRQSFRDLNKKLFNGEGAVTRLDHRTRELEMWRQASAPFGHGPRSRGMPQENTLSSSGELPRAVDKSPASWAAWLLSIHPMVYLLVVINVVTLVLVFSALATPEEVKNLREINEIIRNLPTPMSTPAPGHAPTPTPTPGGG